MRLFDALGHAHAECGKIVGIRNSSKQWVSYDLLNAGEVPPDLTDADFIGDGWEIGWDCEVCKSSGCWQCEDGIFWTDYYGN